MNKIQLIPLVFITAIPVLAQTYRLTDVDIKQRIIWGTEARLPDGTGLAFGGQDQEADDGRPHTRILEDGVWTSIHQELRTDNRNQPIHRLGWAYRDAVKDLRARARHLYFQGRNLSEIEPNLAHLRKTFETRMRNLSVHQGQKYEQGQKQFHLKHLQAATALLQPDIAALRQAQIHLELAAEACDAEPPPRAMHCGFPRKAGEPPIEPRTLVYDQKTNRYLLFGGDHLDYLTNDTWLFDPERKKWLQQHPEGAPPPRANHHLEAKGDGTIVMTGGYTYANNTDYVGGQYRDLDDGTWTYDIETATWSGGERVAADSRTYRSGPFHPEFYLQGDPPDPKAFADWLAKIPDNEWVATNPPYRPRLNRDWGCARIDPDRDLMLRWSGGHSAHGGTDVPHFHFAVNRWELPNPVEFPLGQLYANTRYPNGYNFNLRPWITGHTYQNYAYDPPTKKMVKAGRPKHFYVYDPDKGDWVDRGEKPKAMQYNSCFYTLTLVATPEGAVCWDKNGKVHRYDGRNKTWNPIELTGDQLLGAVVDNSCLAYDSKRDRLLAIVKPYGKAPYNGQVFSVELKTGKVTALSPAGMDLGTQFAYIDRCEYDPDNDLLLLASYVNDAGAVTPTPAYDGKANRWITLDLKYETGTRGQRITRAFPHGRSCGLVYDQKRKLFWGTDTNSQVYVLRLKR